MVYIGGHKMCNTHLSECKSLITVGRFQTLCTLIKSDVRMSVCMLQTIMKAMAFGS